MFGRIMVVLAIQKSAKGNLFDISRPNTGASFFDMEVRNPLDWLAAVHSWGLRALRGPDEALDIFEMQPPHPK